MDPHARNLAVYIGIMIANAAAGWMMVAITSDAVPWFLSDAMAPYKGLALTLLGVIVPIMTGWLAANRSRLGSEYLAAQVDALRERGVSRKDMAIIEDDHTRGGAV